MDKHFTITINDDNGVKQYNLHKFVKKIIKYVILFFAFITLLAVGTILYLNSSVETIEKKRTETQNAYDSLKKKNIELDISITNTQNALKVKKKELTEVSDSLAEIEVLIGLSPVPEMSLQERVDITKLNSQHLVTLMQYIPSGSPIVYKGITSKFGYREHPTLKRKEFHRGTDMRASMNTPVHATADSVVEWAGYHKKSGFGNLVILQHNYGFRTYFGHLNKIVVKSGMFVKKGDLIAYTGTSGMSSGPHLHYEIRFIQRAVNAFWFIKWDVKNYQDIFKKEKKIPWQSLITATARIRIQKQTQTQLLSQLVQKSKVK
ncbi:MAG: peptidase M23 [Sulfurimonas sp.]|nr:MAG: peptidase M23 [Sulfurimonas sp.]